ncbi:MAG: hypothetical protein A2177_05805 [Spirochaetes bacterium RBG_13_68_11]|nr:MAG: hypothetical protein A2177_05805 [Spirochaetes bacterium RBG_13_68_11]
MKIIRIEEENIMHRIYSRAGIALLCIALALSALAGCQPNPDGDLPSVDGLYMTDTFSGKVYVYDTDTHMAGTTSLVTTTQNSTGAIYFYKGIGYITVGNSSNIDPGVYYFDPSASVPQAVRIGSTDRSAQYIAFTSSTKAYVAVADYSGTPSEQGVYTFDPSNPGAGLSSTPITGTNDDDMYLQQIVVGPDNMIYVATNSTLGGADEVLQIDPSTDTLSVTTFPASASGTTALAVGAYDGSNGVFVGNITYTGAGSIDFINTSIPTPSLSQVLPATDVSRLLYLFSGSLVTTGYTNSYIVGGLATGAPSTTELGSNLGGADIAAKDGLIYVGYTDYLTSKLYVFDASGAAESFSPVSVMGAGECVAGLAFYQN